MGSCDGVVNGANTADSFGNDRGNPQAMFRDGSGLKRLSGHQPSLCCGDKARKVCSRVSETAEQGRLVWAGLGQVVAKPLQDSSELLARSDWTALRSRLNEEGYLFLTGAIDPSDVLKASFDLIRSGPLLAH
jgi:hypothetical protein